jgi:hypothetical protein
MLLDLLVGLVKHYPSFNGVEYGRKKIWAYKGHCHQADQMAVRQVAEKWGW